MVAVGLDIGGTKLSAALVDGEGHLRSAPLSVPTPSLGGREAVLQAAAHLVKEVLDADGAKNPKPEVLGVGTAGVISPGGVVTSATDLLKDWAGTNVSAELKRLTGLPATALNDVHAAAVGEAHAALDLGFRRVLVVAVGTGIGGGFVLDGALDLGTSGIAASVGHLFVPHRLKRRCSCGVTGHVEAYASGPSMEAIYNEATGSSLDLRQIEQLAKGGDGAAQGVIREGAKALGFALASAANVTDPDIIVIGGGVSNLGEFLLGPATESYREAVLPPARDIPVVTAKLGTSAAIVGAALTALRNKKLGTASTY